MKKKIKVKKPPVDKSLKYLITSARKIWRWSLDRRIVLKRAKVDKGWKCELCGTIGFITEKTLKNGKVRKVMPVQVDHIDPIGAEPTNWIEVGPWLVRLFCHISNLQCICRECHQVKTNKERAQQREA